MNWLTESGYLSRVSLKRKLTIQIEENPKAITFNTNFCHRRKANMPDYSSRGKKESRRLICLAFVQLNPGPPSSLPYLHSHYYI